MSADPKTLLIVAVRCDHPEEVKRRMQTILAAAASYERPPETVACVFASDITKLDPDDFSALAHFMGRPAVDRLNIDPSDLA